MKQLLAGIILILVLGIGGFLYRNTFEHPISESIQTACTQEAKVCPDGTAVGRTGANCAFAPCPLPNYENSTLELGFVIPNGYAENNAALGKDDTLVAVFDKASGGDTPHSIVVRAFPIEQGSATSTMLAHTMYESSGMLAKTMSEFKKETVGQHTFFCVTLERFEGQVHTACYLPRSADVLRFEVLEKSVTDWTNPKLAISSLPEHRAFYTMLATITP